MIKSQVCDSGASRETHTNFAVYLQRLLDIDYSENSEADKLIKEFIISYKSK